MPSTYYVAWWNLENLFDEEDSPRRTEKLQRAIGSDLACWTPARRDRKIAQLASVIAQMNSGAGPDLLGVCEVENRFVLDLLVAVLNTPLPGRNYTVVHADTDDARGIDVAFIYDADLFDVPAGEVFFHVVMRRNATRELVQVNFKTHKNRTWSVIGDRPDGTFYTTTNRTCSTSSSSTRTWPHRTFRSAPRPTRRWETAPARSRPPSRRSHRRAPSARPGIAA